MILPFTIPKFKINILPNFTTELSTPTKSDYFRMVTSVEKLSTARYIMGRYADTEIPLTPMTAAKFIEDFVRALDELREQNMDVMKVPEQIDYETPKQLALPCLTSGERLVYEHSGIDFERQADMLITEYWILLADAMKMKILSRSDGFDYLEQCYRDMHKINTLTATVTD